MIGSRRIQYRAQVTYLCVGNSLCCGSEHESKLQERPSICGQNSQGYSLYTPQIWLLVKNFEQFCGKIKKVGLRQF